LALGSTPVFLVHEPGNVPVRRLVVLDHTKLSFQDVGRSESDRISERDRLAQKLDPSDRQLVMDLFDPAAEAARLEQCFSLEVPVSFISDVEMEHLFEDMAYQGWKPFWNRYPDAQGILTLSRVSFNASGTRALVYVGNQSGADIGRGFYLVLRRTGRAWAIDRQVDMWVS
jgi:hypothetical protein